MTRQPTNSEVAQSTVSLLRDSVIGGEAIRQKFSLNEELTTDRNTLRFGKLAVYVDQNFDTLVSPETEIPGDELLGLSRDYIDLRLGLDVGGMVLQKYCNKQQKALQDLLEDKEVTVRDYPNSEKSCISVVVHGVKMGEHTNDPRIRRRVKGVPCVIHGHALEGRILLQADDSLRWQAQVVAPVSGRQTLQLSVSKRRPETYKR